MQVVLLKVPAMPCVVSGSSAPVFDAWGWCESDVIEWRRLDGIDGVDRFSANTPIDSENPADLVFVFRKDTNVDCTFLPKELAHLHAMGYGLDETDWSLAPWAIDDATDLFFERKVRPRDVLWLAAPSLRALVWGLHDWVHFHNHGPFDQPAMTELQCDLIALAWLRLNREAIGVDATTLDRVARELAALSRSRFASEGKAPPHADLDALFAGPYPT